MSTCITDDDKQSYELYIVKEWNYFGKKSYSVCNFFPGKKDENSDNYADNEKGNWFSIIPDKRSLEDMMSSDFVEGMICLEGGNAMRKVKPSEIFTSMQTANEYVKKLNDRY